MVHCILKGPGNAWNGHGRHSDIPMAFILVFTNIREQFNCDDEWHDRSIAVR